MQDAGGGPLVWYRDRRRSGQWPGLGPLGHAHDVEQLGDRHDAHDGPVVSCAHRGSGLLHLLAGDCWLSRASGRCWAQRGKRSRYPAQTLGAWRDQQGRVCGHAPRSPGERLTHAVRRRTRQAYFALRIGSPAQRGKDGLSKPGGDVRDLREKGRQDDSTAFSCAYRL
jgi:hypothetical protein